jgi:hypothetical protein
MEAGFEPFFGLAVQWGVRGFILAGQGTAYCRGANVSTLQGLVNHSQFISIP